MNQQNNIKLYALLFIACLVTNGHPILANAQSSAPAAVSSASGTSMTRAERRAQHKAERKAARDQNRAEIKTMTQGGYRPGLDIANYPQNAQQAAKTAASAPASVGAPQH
ncbi:DUF4148 domain-containing protein [Paraburkholderia sp. J12]|uniref:DUF4148 domain-containing protein n=1 Tax=Paraburkholderia sp. J12 TaxID=2805432 RepID=UPI002ABDC6DA|nr:DUF4148 domain-containing protein [Paraburkholderia sp. J12]